MSLPAGPRRKTTLPDPDSLRMEISGRHRKRRNELCSLYFVLCSLRFLCVLCVSAVISAALNKTAETQRTQRKRRENKSTKYKAQPNNMKPISYSDAGVDIDAATRATDRIKELARTTFNQRTLSEIGSFGGMFDGAFPNLANPVLVASADGVGTKLKIAFATGVHNTIGEDLVNHCVNDIRSEE